MKMRMVLIHEKSFVSEFIIQVINVFHWSASEKKEERLTSQRVLFQKNNRIS